jgi:DNA-binding beta-propeller fold protein YncE
MSARREALLALRRALAGAAVVAVVAWCAGCTSGSARPPSASRAPSAAATVRITEPPRPARALRSPGCSTATSASGALSSARTAMFTVPGNPFGVAVTPDGRWAFVAESGGSIEVFRVTGPLTLVPVRSIPVPGVPLGETITPDGKYLLAAAGDGAIVISVARAVAGAADAVAGTLSASASGGPGGGGAIEVAVSPDGRFAFVSLENADKAAVFNLGKALAGGFGPADYVGAIPLELAPVGLAVSPDGRWLYATSEIASPSVGTLSVVSLARAETDPAASVAATVDAGCQPVRVITSADGTEVWVTARGSDDLLCFSAARLASDPARALVSAVRVGEAPVGLAAVRGGSIMVVADSNRFGVRGGGADLDVVSVAAALSGGPAVVGHVRAGLFPRDMTVAPDGTLLVSNFSSGQLEAVALGS